MLIIGCVLLVLVILMYWYSFYKISEMFDSILEEFENIINLFDNKNR
jgi:hypothetical protein